MSPINVPAHAPPIFVGERTVREAPLMSIYPNFRTDGFHWIADLPDDAPRFLSFPLTINLSDGQGGFSGFLTALGNPTLRGNGELIVEIPDLNDRAPDPRFLGVAEELLRNLPEMIKVGEEAFKGYEPDFHDLRLIPKISIDEEHIDSNPSRWTLVVEQEDSPIAWHLEFEGARFQEIWSGS